MKHYTRNHSHDQYHYIKTNNKGMIIYHVVFINRTNSILCIIHEASLGLADYEIVYYCVVFFGDKT